jgi:hypothetical protein
MRAGYGARCKERDVPCSNVVGGRAVPATDAGEVVAMLAVSVGSPAAFGAASTRIDARNDGYRNACELRRGSTRLLLALKDEVSGAENGNDRA